MVIFGVHRDTVSLKQLHKMGTQISIPIQNTVSVYRFLAKTYTGGIGISFIPVNTEKFGIPGVEFRFGLRESKLIFKFQLLHISMEKLILISGCYENHCENRFSDSRRISSPVYRYYLENGGKKSSIGKNIRELCLFYKCLCCMFT